MIKCSVLFGVNISVFPVKQSLGLIRRSFSSAAVGGSDRIHWQDSSIVDPMCVYPISRNCWFGSVYVLGAFLVYVHSASVSSEARATP